MEACIPQMPGKSMPHGGVAAYLAELLRLSPAQLIGTGILLQKRLGVLTSSGTDEYRVPADRDLVVFQIQSTYRSSDLTTEPVLNANITAFDIDGLEQARLSNCALSLINRDRQLKVFDNRDMVMSAIRKTPMYFPPMAPLLVPATHSLQASFTLQSVAAAVAGNNADYGVMLTGVLIPKRV